MNAIARVDLIGYEKDVFLVGWFVGLLQLVQIYTLQI